MQDAGQGFMIVTCALFQGKYRIYSKRKHIAAKL